MIARQYRFHGYNALRFVYKQGKTARTACCLLRYTPNSRRTMCRIAVVVGKKVNKSAVARNRMRRRIYAAVQGIVADLPPYDLVFTVVDGAIDEMSEKDINNIILQLLQIATNSHLLVDNSDK
jgi:ribonuclease P protein component